MEMTKVGEDDEVIVWFESNDMPRLETVIMFDEDVDVASSEECMLQETDPWLTNMEVDETVPEDSQVEATRNVEAEAFVERPATVDITEGPATMEIVADLEMVFIPFEEHDK